MSIPRGDNFRDLVLDFHHVSLEITDASERKAFLFANRLLSHANCGKFCVSHLDFILPNAPVSLLLLLSLVWILFPVDHKTH